jgi:hypothetical protein
MASESDAAQKYHGAISLLAQSAEEDNAHDLAALLESVASAIALGLVPDLANTCMKFWTDRTREKTGD